MAISLETLTRGALGSKGTLGGKLTLTFGGMLAILCLSTLTTIYSSGEVLDLQEEVTEVHHPNEVSGMALMGAISASSADLQSYLVTGREADKASRSARWEKIFGHHAALQQRAQHWSQEHRDELEQLSVTLQKLEKAQGEVEAVAHTSDEQPALKVMLTQAAPRAATIVKALTTLIEAEKRLPADRVRKQLLAQMGDARASFAMGTSNIRAFLLSGDDKWAMQFEQNWMLFDVMEQRLQKTRPYMSPVQMGALDELKQLKAEFKPLQERMFDIRSGKDWNKPTSLVRDKVQPLTDDASQLVTAIVAYQQAEGQAQTQRLQSLASTLRWKVGLIFLLGLAAGVWIAVQMTRSITQRVGVLLEAMARASEGDLTTTVEVDGEDEIAQVGEQLARLLSATRESTSELIRQVTLAASAAQRLADVAVTMEDDTSNMKTRTDEVTGTVDQLGSNISTVAAAAEESTAALSTVAGNVERMSDSFEAVNVQVQHLTENFHSVVEAVDEMKDSLGGVAQNTDKAATISKEAAQMARSSDEIVTALGQSAKEISEVVGVISEIADQTNLLALNASIEAATAGDAGKGFAVVASEVKALAKQTATATWEIEEKIQRIESSTEGAVEAIRNIVDVIERIDGFSQKTAVALRDQQITAAQIAESMNDAARTASTINTYVSECTQEASGASLSFEALTEGAKDIAQSASLLSSGAGDVSANMVEMGGRVEQTSEGAGRVSVASSELAQMAKAMSELVSRFRV